MTKFELELCSVPRTSPSAQRLLAFTRDTLFYRIFADSFILMNSVYGKMLNVYYRNCNLMLRNPVRFSDKIQDRVRDKVCS